MHVKLQVYIYLCYAQAIDVLTLIELNTQIQIIQLIESSHNTQTQIYLVAQA